MNEESVAKLLRLTDQTSEAFHSTTTPGERATIRATHDDSDKPAVVFPAANGEEALLAFAADGVKALADEIQCVVDQRVEEMYRQALEVYYKAEELARDPEHAHLIEHVEAMRRAHQAQYGCPIPPIRSTD